MTVAGFAGFVTPTERKKHRRLNQSSHSRSQRLARRFELERERRARRATPPHALRARNLHTPPPTCPPSRPAPALASRPPPKTAPPRYAARARWLPRALQSRVPRPFPTSAPVARARPIARGAETDATRALHAPWCLLPRVRARRRAASACSAPHARRRARLAASRVSKRPPFVVARLL